jgi:hypothetical protein
MYEDATAKNYCSIPQFVYDVCVCHFSLHEMTPMRLREITDDVVDLLRSPLKWESIPENPFSSLLLFLVRIHSR